MEVDSQSAWHVEQQERAGRSGLSPDENIASKKRYLPREYKTGFVASLRDKITE